MYELPLEVVFCSVAMADVCKYAQVERHERSRQSQQRDESHSDDGLFFD